MSLLFRVHRFNNLLKRRSLFYSNNILEAPALTNSFQTTRLSLSTYKKNDEEQERKKRKEFQEKFDYTVKFKELNARKVFKEFYSLYGPLFVVCHIGVSLASLGIFSSLVWLIVDPIQYIPEVLRTRIGETAIQMTGGGGKFVIAYAAHKIILPLRLGAAIWLTQLFGTKVKLRRQSNNPKIS